MCVDRAEPVDMQNFLSNIQEAGLKIALVLISLKATSLGLPESIRLHGERATNT
jgi:hypothetical protein